MAGERDDLDALLRTAMKTLDEQVPSGYFEALPGRTLARLAAEEGTMQAGSTSGTEAKSSPATAAPPGTPQADEDSGLHDIRNLAQTTKERISSKKISTGSVTKTDEELLASASGSWKSLALPQPASMIALPDVASLPHASVVESTPVAKPMFASTTAAAKAAAAPAKSRKVMAIAGVGIAAAAGVTLFVTMQSKGTAPDAAPTSVPTPTVVAAAPPPAPAAPVVQHIDDPAPSTGNAAAGSAAEAAVAPAQPVTTTTTPPPPAKIATKSRGKTAEPAAHSAKPTAIAKADVPPQTTATPPPAAASDNTKKSEKPAGGDESFDALLKEAGVADKPKDAPVLDKKELSANDFKAGMSAIQSKAQGCFKGTQGMATVKLVIAPSGKVTRVTVTGKFSGQPEAACVTAAVKSATFPPWDGGSQTMGYSFLLSE
jgi:hypothetical protein